MPTKELALSVVERIDASCDRFELDWRAGRDPRVEDYLAVAPASDREARSSRSRQNCAAVRMTRPSPERQARSHNSMGILLAELGKRAEAEGEHRKAQAIREKLATDFPAVPAYRADFVETFNNFACLYAMTSGKEAESNRSTPNEQWNCCIRP